MRFRLIFVAKLVADRWFDVWFIPDSGLHRNPFLNVQILQAASGPAYTMGIPALVNIEILKHVKYKWVARIYSHDDVIKWKHFPRYWPFVLVFPHKDQWRGALMFSLICAWINGWVNILGLVIWDVIELWRHCNATKIWQRPPLSNNKVRLIVFYNESKVNAIFFII